MNHWSAKKMSLKEKSKVCSGRYTNSEQGKKNKKIVQKTTTCSNWSWNSRKSSEIRHKHRLKSNKLCAWKKINRRRNKTSPKSL